MARITKLSRQDVDGATLETFERLGRQRGNVPNLFRIYAHRPAMMSSLLDHLQAVTTGGTVPTLTKEFVATLVSRINHCHY